MIREVSSVSQDKVQLRGVARKALSEPIDKRLEEGQLAPEESREGEQKRVTAPTAFPVDDDRPLVTLEPHRPLEIPEIPKMMSPAVRHLHRFLDLFRKKPEIQSAWGQVWRFLPTYSQDQVDLPFPHATDEKGHIELNDTEILVRGLRAQGAHSEARGILENWLSLGERYTNIPGSNQLNELGRSGAPKLSRLLLEKAETHPDPDFLARAYKGVADDYNNNWADPYFKQHTSGLNRYCDVDYSYDATLIEAGGDKNSGRFKGNPLNFIPVDLNADLYRTERDLASMARKLGRTEMAEVWEERAQLRKRTVIDQLWDEKEGFFYDGLTVGGRSETKTLAAFGVLESGMLNPGEPVERRMAERMMGHLADFIKPGNNVVWETDRERPADPGDLVLLGRGFQRAGATFEQACPDLADKLSQAAQLFGEAARESTARPEVGRSTRELAVRLYLENQQEIREEPGLEAYVSPLGLMRLRQLQRQISQAAPQVRPQDCGRIDRRLAQLHESMLDSGVVREVERRGLLQPVYHLDFADTVRLAPPHGEALQPLEGALQVGDRSLHFGVPTQVQKLDEQAYLLEARGAKMAVVKSDSHLILGDRAYPLDLFESEVHLPGDIFSHFYRAGKNPALENFYHHNRDWVQLETGPTSEVVELEGRPEWTDLFRAVGENWSKLTIQPSVVAHDTAMQYFNPAAVPSLGIFKTQFNWDSFFMAKGMQLQGHETTAVSMVDNLLYLLKDIGRTPNAARSVYCNKSQANFLPSLVRLSEPIRNRIFGEKLTREWVCEAYKLLDKDFHHFWREPGGRGVGEIDGQRVALSRWGGPNHKFAMDESGHDTSSRYYHANEKAVADLRPESFKCIAKDLVPPDLNAFLWGNARDLEAIALRQRDHAQEIGDHQKALHWMSEADRWRQEKEAIKRDVIRFNWDDQDGIFRDYRFQGDQPGLMKREASISAVVAPLWEGMLDPSNKTEKEMIERSLDAVIERFECDHGLAATDDGSQPWHQWNKPSGWAPLQMMAIETLVRYGRHEDAARCLQKWLDTISRVNSESVAKSGKRMILERYNVVTGGHPPVQAGRYETTEGDESGFGWTNATIPWGVVEVIGGVRLHRDPERPLRMEVIPNIPPAMLDKTVALDFANPGNGDRWSVRQKQGETSYEFEMSGDFSRLPDVDLVTPNLPGDAVPVKGGQTPHYTTESIYDGRGQVRYRVKFRGLDGQSSIKLKFAPLATEPRD